VSQRTIWSWFNQGLPRVKIGGLTLTKAEWVDEFLKAREVKNTNQADRVVTELVREMRG
jgi:hypothetical protein